MRLDWFLPALRKSKDGIPVRQSRIGRITRDMLPSSLVSNHKTKQRGTIRKFLRSLGASWLHSPLRRGCQTACFIVFLWLFFYVCWPYTAKPAPPSEVSTGWRLVEFAQEEGGFRLTHDALPEGTMPNWLRNAARTHVVDESKMDASDGYVGPFRTANGGPSDVLMLVPEGEFSAHTMDRLLTGTGPWALHQTPPNAWPSHYADDLVRKELLPADAFLVIDPLVSLSTALAARSWVWSLTWAAVIVGVCVLIPRGFCGYLCPLGTLIDLFDWAVGRRITRFRVANDGWWVHVKYYLLLGCLVASLFGVLISGYVAAIPVITRGLLFFAEPMQTGTLRGWHLVPPLGVGQVVSLLLFASVLGLGLLKPRFWCKYVCPSGAVFSLGNLFRVSQRKVESSCIHCNKCIEVCPFDAIKPDFTTRVTDCTLCQTCGGVCPTHAIKFVERGNLVELKVANDPPTGETAMGRRGFLSAVAGTTAAVVGAASVAGVTKTFGARLGTATRPLPVRPPGSVPEQEFLQLCIRCGECFKACPNNVLQPLGFQQGLEGLWTPQVVADWAGCESSCNACGQVCPTGAIRALPLEEKKVVRMGLAIVNPRTCLPFADQEACQLCVDECNAAGYYAIEFTRVHTQVDDDGQPLADTGYVAPVVLADKCVGCGLCQTRCFGINVQERGVLATSAIIVEAGEGKEDRISQGSYISLRRDQASPKVLPLEPEPEFFVPSAPIPDESDTDDLDPFGLSTEGGSGP